MRKRILIVIILLLFTTGCTCQYNLTIENNTFKEEVKLTSSDSSELETFTTNWQVPINKNEYNIGLDPDWNGLSTGNIYKYNLSGNTLKFNYDFDITEYPYSSAVSNCYNTLTIINKFNNIIISTSKENNCFNNYPSLNSLRVAIKTDLTVKSHNADSINGNTYIWNITKSNASNKPINLILTNNNNSDGNNQNEEKNKNIKVKKDYSLYIFCGILLIAMLSVYFVFKKLKKDNGVDD